MVPICVKRHKYPHKGLAQKIMKTSIGTGEEAGAITTPDYLNSHDACQVGIN